jgi:hypothetical protein
VQNSKQLVQFPCNNPDDVLYRPDAQLSKHYLSGRLEQSVWTFLYDEKLRTVPSCIRPDASATRPNTVLCSTSYGISFQKHRYGKIAATVRTMCVPVWTLSFIRQVVHSKFNSLHGPDARASYMEIDCIKSTVRTTAVMVRTRQALLWKLCAAKVQPSGL